MKNYRTYQRQFVDATSAEICDVRTIASRAEQFLLSVATTDCGLGATSAHSVSTAVDSAAGGAPVDDGPSGIVDPAVESPVSATKVSELLASSLYTSQIYTSTE